MKIRMVEHQVAENMQGILSARVLKEGSKKTGKIVGLYEVPASRPHWLA